ncbi:mechanosensitive ion channel family protein [Rickettsia endosymbiont of Gonocerus acuteangulatus]|uniref:mechanosensitive ion channel family protein n=1 Tax=Rickettsia endosymbiont of Gonocerus acuteangulatus TaxID=3066266 RepID=UPI003132E906
MYHIEEGIELITQKFLALWKYELFPIANNQITVSNICIFILLLLFGVKYSERLSRSVNNFVNHRLKGNNTSASILSKLIIYSIRILYIIIAMSLANIPMGSLAILGGALAFGLGFGTQTLITNFISGIIIMIEQPIKEGDIIEIKGVIGKVKTIGIRCIILKTTTNHSILIPSSEIILNNVTNWTLDNNIVKYQLEITFPSSETKLNPESLMDKLKTSMSKLDFIIPNEEANVFLTKVDNNGLTFYIRFNIDIKKNSDFEYIKNNLNIALYSQLKNYNIILNHLDCTKI